MQRWGESAWLGPAVVALLSFVAVVLTIDPANWLLLSAEGPGITLDESFNVVMGAYLVELVRSLGISLLDPASVMEGFSVYNADHPPFGRLWLGIFHSLTQSWVSGEIPQQPGMLTTLTVCARIGSAAAFAITVWLTGWFAGTNWGRRCGWIASVALVLMPRVFGDAHLASLETVLNLTWSAAIFSVAHFWSAGERPSGRAATWTGVLFGLLLLTKIQAVLLPPLVIAWAVFHWRGAAIKPVAIWLLVGAVVFCVSWPWLWSDLPQRLWEYFGRSTNRVELHCWYLGQKFVDREVPWHYPWVMFVVTMPIGLLAMGGWGLFQVRRDVVRSPRISLIVGGLIAPLLLFSTSVAVYDGVRLFLICFPLWAVLTGIGFESLGELLARKNRRPNAVLAALLICQSVGVVAYSPYWLSYYNGLTGGLYGAEKLGFEVSYWGDSLSRSFDEEVARRVPSNTDVAVVPIMHQFYLPELMKQVPAFKEHQLRLVAMDWPDKQTKYLISFARKADLPTEDELAAAGWKRVYVHRQMGVEVAAMWERDVRP